jgi:hypothetical protein
VSSPDPPRGGRRGSGPGDDPSGPADDDRLLILTAQDARQQLGRTKYSRLLGLGVHHTDDEGHPYWYETVDWFDHLDELIAPDIGEVVERTGLSRPQVQRLVRNGLLTSRNFPGTRPAVLASEIERINKCVRTADTAG